MITREDLNQGMFGTGGMDISGEWEWSGNYYMTLHRDIETGQKHNYYISFTRRGSRRKTLGWYGYVSIALKATNATDITVCQFKDRSIKKCKDKILGWINYFEDNVGDEKIKEWKDKRRKPVFILEDNEPIIVTHTYDYPSKDFEVNERKGKRDNYTYWKDMDYDYMSGVKYYTMDTYGWGDNRRLSFHRCERSWGGYCSGGTELTDEEKKTLSKKIFSMVERNPMYAQYVDNIKDLI